MPVMIDEVVVDVVPEGADRGTGTPRESASARFCDALAEAAEHDHRRRRRELD